MKKNYINILIIIISFIIISCKVSGSKKVSNKDEFLKLIKNEKMKDSFNDLIMKENWNINDIKHDLSNDIHKSKLFKSFRFENDNKKEELFKNLQIELGRNQKAIYHNIFKKNVNSILDKCADIKNGFYNFQIYIIKKVIKNDPKMNVRIFDNRELFINKCVEYYAKMSINEIRYMNQYFIDKLIVMKSFKKGLGFLMNYIVMELYDKNMYQSMTEEIMKNYSNRLLTKKINDYLKTIFECNKDKSIYIYFLIFNSNFLKNIECILLKESTYFIKGISKENWEKYSKRIKIFDEVLLNFKALDFISAYTKKLPKFYNIEISKIKIKEKQQLFMFYNNKKWLIEDIKKKVEFTYLDFKSMISEYNLKSNLKSSQMYDFCHKTKNYIKNLKLHDKSFDQYSVFKINEYIIYDIKTYLASNISMNHGDAVEDFEECTNIQDHEMCVEYLEYIHPISANLAHFDMYNYQLIDILRSNNINEIKNHLNKDLANYLTKHYRNLVLKFHYLLLLDYEIDLKKIFFEIIIIYKEQQKYPPMNGCTLDLLPWQTNNLIKIASIKYPINKNEISKKNLNLFKFILNHNIKTIKTKINLDFTCNKLYNIHPNSYFYNDSKLENIIVKYLKKNTCKFKDPVQSKLLLFLSHFLIPNEAQLVSSYCKQNFKPYLTNSILYTILLFLKNTNVTSFTPLVNKYNLINFEFFSINDNILLPTMYYTYIFDIIYSNTSIKKF